MTRQSFRERFLATAKHVESVCRNLHYRCGVYTVFQTKPKECIKYRAYVPMVLGDFGFAADAAIAVNYWHAYHHPKAKGVLNKIADGEWKHD